MIVTAIKTTRITSSSHNLTDLLDEYIKELPPRSVLAITSKIVSLCEGRTVPQAGTDKQALIRQESDYYMDEPEGPWGIQFTVTNNILIPNAGIDESNVGTDVYALWPADPQATANMVRAYLAKRFGHEELGVIITDSTCRPLVRGVSGIAIAFSGIRPIRNYVGTPDLFGRPFKVSQADIVGGLAAAAVLVGGEGSETTPLTLISDVTFAEFVPRDPTPEELSAVHIPLEEDLFGPFLSKATWLPGDKTRMEEQ